MQISIRTTWSTAQITIGCHQKYKSPQRHLWVPIRTVDKRRRLCCWCATEPVLDSRDAGASLDNSALEFKPLISVVVFFLKNITLLGFLQIWESLYPLFGAYSYMGYTAEGDFGENEASFAAWSLCAGTFLCSPNTLILIISWLCSCCRFKNIFSLMSCR